MPTTLQNPDDENAKHVREALARALNPTLIQVQQALARMQAQQQAQLRLAAVPVARFQEQWARYVREVLAPAEEERRRVVRQAMEQWTTGFRAAYLASARQQSVLAGAAARAALRMDTSGLSRLLRDVETWQALTEQQRTATLAAVERAYEGASDDDVTEDMVTDLEETARAFAASETEYLPIEVSRQAFVLFVGTLVLLAMMTLSFSSDTADAVMGKAIEYSPAVGVAMFAAGRAWDRYTGNETPDTEGN
ncbi:hypothetical protein ACWERF_19140 [Streptomyces griseoluteus]